MNSTVVPHALTVAHTKLVAELEKGISQYKARLGYSNREKIKSAIERFVYEFCRIPEWEREFSNRASVVTESCRQGSVFRQRMDAACACYRRQPKRIVGPQLSSAKLAIQGLKPKHDSRLESELSEWIAAVEKAQREGVISVRNRSQFAQLVQEAKRIKRAAQRVEADGCYIMCEVQQAANSLVSNYATAFTVLLMTDAGGCLLEDIKAAADSLIAWVKTDPGKNKSKESSQSKEPLADDPNLRLSIDEDLAQATLDGRAIALEQDAARLLSACLRKWPARVIASLMDIRPDRVRDSFRDN